MDKIKTRMSMIDSIIRRERVTEVSPVDHVVMSADNYEAFEEKLDPRQLQPAFIQDDWLKGRFRKYEIYNKHYLFQTIKHYRDKECKTYRLNLAWLDPKPETVEIIAWRWVSTALATAVWALLLFYMAYSGADKDEYVASATILMGTVTVIALCLLLYSRENKLVFNSYLSNVPLIEIDRNKPDKATFDNFVHDLRNGIYAGWQHKDIQQMLVGEIRELRRLRDIGIISEATYLNARSAIFNHREYQIKSSLVDEALENDKDCLLL